MNEIVLPYEERRGVVDSRRGTRFARRAARESGGGGWLWTRGSHRRLKQPRTDFCNIFDVVIMPRFARKEIATVSGAR